VLTSVALITINFRMSRKAARRPGAGAAVVGRRRRRRLRDGCRCDNRTHRGRDRPVTNIALGAVRALEYVSIALVVGAVAFLTWVAPESLLGGEFERRVWRLLIAGLTLGVAVGVLGILLQAAHLSGVALWSLRWSAVSSVLGSRFGLVWGVRAALLAASVAALAFRRRRAFRLWLFALCAFLVLTPALSGHAAVQSPVWAFFPSDVLHVLAVSVWVGGVACLLYALPPALRAATPAGRTTVLLDVLGRFSPLALTAVAVIALTGVIQAYIEVRTLNALTHSTFGELVLLKIGLLGLLIGLGAINRERLIPTLRRLAAAASQPGEIGVQLRRTTIGELTAMACVFAVTAALLAYTPPIAATGSSPKPSASARAVLSRSAAATVARPRHDRM
jgi:copper transport protein